MSSLAEPVFDAKNIDFSLLYKLSILDCDKKSEMDETDDLSAGFHTPSETTAEHDQEPDMQPSTSTSPESAICPPTASWWKGVSPAAALFTPILPPDVKFDPLSQASLPSSYHPNSITAANERPVIFDVAAMSGLLGKTRGSVSIKDMSDAWWNVSDETQHMHDAAASAVRKLHKLTNTGRTDLSSGDDRDPDFGATSLRAKKAIQRSAEAVQQLVFLADAISSQVSRHRFWQWSTWMQNKEIISPADAAAYLLANMEAKEALDKAKAAATQAMAASKATDDYK
ncbi:hypothetical protein Sste5346_006970 [Sporothrix stenoceras]|uniref:Uncharacterized protein n=1 Tax=Sporothrix stenoceras TaxID=5173 RepID=A0ABR3YWM0_9PEZI